MKFTRFLLVMLISMLFCVMLSCNKKELQPAFYNKIDTETANILNVIKQCNQQNKFLIERIVYLHREQNKLNVLKTNVLHSKTKNVIAQQIQTHADSISILTDSLHLMLDSIAVWNNTLYIKLKDTSTTVPDSLIHYIACLEKERGALNESVKNLTQTGSPKLEQMVEIHTKNIDLIQKFINRITANDSQKEIPVVFLPYYQPVYRIQFTNADKLLSIKELKRIYKNDEAVFIDINAGYLYSYGTYYHRDSAQKALQKIKQNNYSVVFDMGSLPVHVEVFSKPVIETGYIYRLQVAATQKPIPDASLQNFRNLHPVLIIDTTKNMFKYKLGKFVTYEEANDFKTRHKLDAFVCKEKKNSRDD